MNSIGVQRDQQTCSELLLELCGSSRQPRAIVDHGGTVLVASELFRAVAAREPGLPALLRDVPTAAGRRGTAWLDDGWLVLQAQLLVGSQVHAVQIFGPAVVRALLARTFDVRLSTREGECLALALEGAENGAVANRLGVRPETVKVHLRNAYRKLGAGGRAEILAHLVEAT